MKTIKTREDIDALRKSNLPEKVIAHIEWYYNRLVVLFDNYVPEDYGWTILIEKDDPITDATFLIDKLNIRFNQNLVSILKEYVDFAPESNLFTLVCLFTDDFGMTYMIPNEEFIGADLLNQLTKFANVPIT